MSWGRLSWGRSGWMSGQRFPDYLSKSGRLFNRSSHPLGGFHRCIAFCNTESTLKGMETSSGKDNPISMRLPAADISLIDRAAAVRGRSRTDFMREAAVRLAESVLLETTIIRMNPDAYADFMAVLAAPAAPVPELVEVFERVAPWER